MRMSAFVNTLSQNNCSRQCMPLTLILAIFVAGVLGTTAYAQQEFPIYPKYQVLGVVYAPPGSASSVTYGSTKFVGSTNSLVLNSASDNVTTTSQTTGFSLFGFGDSTTTTTSNSWGTASTASKTYTMQAQTGNSVTTMGPVSSALGVNHDNDIIYIWLNPVVLANVASTGAGSGPPYGLNWRGLQFNSCDLTDAGDQVTFLQLMNGCDPLQYPFPDIVGIPVWCLKNPYYPGPACAQWAAFTSRPWDLTPWASDTSGVPLGPGLNLQDYADILRADPFVTQTITPDIYTADSYCHPTYGVNLDPNDSEVIPDSTHFPTTALYTGRSWPANFCGTAGRIMDRFDPYGTVQYPAPGPSGEPQTYSGDFAYTTSSAAGSSATTTRSYSYNQNTTYSFSFGASFAPLLNTPGAVFANNLSAGFNFSFSNGSGYSYSSSQTNANTSTSGTSNTAAYAITGPQSSDNYTGPIVFGVYKDNVWGTFAFYSNEQRLVPPIQLSLVSGQAPILVSAMSNFGTVSVGLSSAAQTITLTNNSPNWMTMVAPAVTFNDPGFQIVALSDFCSNALVPSGGTCQMAIQFAPVLSDAPNAIRTTYPLTASLIAAGTENIAFYFQTTPYYENILVTSTGVTASATATPGATTVGATLTPATANTTCYLPATAGCYTFTTVTQGSAGWNNPQTQVFTFKNYYNSPVVMSGSAGTLGSGFTLSDTIGNYSISVDACSGTTVPSLGTCQFTLKYVPKATGSLNTKITIWGTVNGANTALTFAGATGLVQTVGIGASGASLTLYTTCPGCPGSTSAPMTITNTSSFTLTNVQVSVASTSGPNGWGASGCSGSIAPGGSCQGTINFSYNGGCSSNCTATGTATVTGIENGTNASATAAVSCSITFQFGGIKIDGAELSKTVSKAATHGKASIIVSGLVRKPFKGTRQIVLTVGGFTASASYRSTASKHYVANALAVAANVSESPVKARVEGDTVTLSSKVTGPRGNLSFTAVNSRDFSVTPNPGSLTGGARAKTYTVYDGGKVMAAVGSVTASTKWGKASSPHTIATELAAALNSKANGAFTATVSGAVVTIVYGSSSTPTVTAGVVDSQGFDPASFAASPAN